MEIDKDLLTKKYVEGDMNYFFEKALEISSFVIVDQFKIYNQDIIQDMKQECMENLWKKVITGKVNPDKNLFAFVWKNSYYRILEILRKDSNRNRIASMSCYDELSENSEYPEVAVNYGNKYVSTLVKELSTS